jgi:predicted ester cyclase
MSAETDLVQKSLEETFNNGDVASVAKFFSPDLQEAVSQAVKENRAGFPDLRYKVDHITSAGNQVIFTYTATGTHKGVFEGRRPTGKTAEWHGSVIATVQRGKIVHIHVDEDHLRRDMQLGELLDLTPSMTGTWVGSSSGITVTLHLTQTGDNITGDVTITGFSGTYPVTGTNNYPNVTLNASPAGIPAQFVGKFSGPDSVPGVLTMMGSSLDVTINRQ